MKKLILLSLMCISMTAMADPHRGYHGGHHGGGWGWVAPALIGGAVVYAATRPAPQPVVVVQPQPQVAPPAPYGYHYENILDAHCNCYRLVLIQN